MPYTNDIYEEIEQFCGIKFSTAEQHVDATDVQMKRDNADIKKFLNYLRSMTHFHKVRVLPSCQYP